MKALILCAGFGKRLGSYTNTYQKTMLPLHGKPILEYILNGLIFAGLKEFVMVVGYKKEQIINYFQNGKKWGVNIEYVEQKKLNGTGGAILLCESLISDDHFYLTWGDIIVPYYIYKSVYDLYTNKGEDFILVTNYAEDTSHGAAVICSEGYCQKIIEKPPPGTVNSNLNNCGIFILSTEIFQILKIIKPSSRGEIDVPEAISLGINKLNWKIRVLEMQENQFRGDLGNLEEYERLKKETNWLNKLFSH